MYNLEVFFFMDAFMSVVFMHGGKKRTGEYANCAICNSEFIRRAKEPKGKQKKSCCSAECTQKFRLRHQPQVQCASCSKEFFKRKSSLAKSASGLYFCSGECRNKEQRIGGLIAPEHYGTSTGKSSTYWTIAEQNNLAKCVECGIELRALLTVHHIDGCRENNSPDNLEFVCHTHHAMRHMKYIGNCWLYDSSFVTPREKFQEILDEMGHGVVESIPEKEKGVPRNAVNELNCAVCDKIIYRSNWNIKMSKTGIFCCSLECKNIAQQGKINVPGIEKLAHRFIHGASRYMNAKKGENSCCADCGLSYKPFLVVHHKDSNRENGADDNLEVLCFNHHVVRHLALDDNQQYRWSTSSLSSPETIKTVNDLIKNNMGS